jgi:hypothetical protein
MKRSRPVSNIERFTSMSYPVAPLTKEQIDGLVDALNRRDAEDNIITTATYRTEITTTYRAEIGPKYVRIVRNYCGSDSAFCFLEKSTGYILKSAGWKAPAKGARGTVHTPTFGVEYVDIYGARRYR